MVFIHMLERIPRRYKLNSRVIQVLKTPIRNIYLPLKGSFNWNNFPQYALRLETFGIQPRKVWCTQYAYTACVLLLWIKTFSTEIYVDVSTSMNASYFTLPDHLQPIITHYSSTTFPGHRISHLLHRLHGLQAFVF